MVLVERKLQRTILILFQIFLDHLKIDLKSSIQILQQKHLLMKKLLQPVQEINFADYTLVIKIPLHLTKHQHKEAHFFSINKFSNVMFSKTKEGIKAIIDPIKQVPIVIAIG